MVQYNIERYQFRTYAATTKGLKHLRQLMTKYNPMTSWVFGLLAAVLPTW